MKNKRTIKTMLFVTMLLVLGVANSAHAKGHATIPLAVGGYDVVAYQTEGQPVRGNGHNVATYQGDTYLFTSDKNKTMFEANPERFAPTYGGYCAYGVSVGKKFVGDPEVWKVVDGRLYLNLDRDIQKTWKQDIPGNIAKAESNWATIKDKAPSEL